MKESRAILFAALLTFPAAFAAAADDPVETIHYADLDISRPEGAHALYRRIEAAAHRVCQPPITSSRRAAQIEQACFTKSVTTAVDSVHSEALSQQLRGSLATRLASN